MALRGKAQRRHRSRWRNNLQWRRFSVGTLFWWDSKAASAQLTPVEWDDRNGADLDPGHGTRKYVGAGRGSPWLIRWKMCYRNALILVTGGKIVPYLFSVRLTPMILIMSLEDYTAIKTVV